jgi:hypothetical protein
MSLPHVTICDCVTERTGVPHVFIPRDKYDALMALMAAVKDILQIARNSKTSRTNPNTTFVDTRDWEAVLAALRAAGIQIEGT